MIDRSSIITGFVHSWRVLAFFVGVGLLCWKKGRLARRIYRWLQPSLAKWPGQWLAPRYRNLLNFDIEFSIHITLFWVTDAQIDGNAVSCEIVSWSDRCARIAHTATPNKLSLSLHSVPFLLRWHEADHGIQVEIQTQSDCKSTYRGYKSLITNLRHQIVRLIDMFSDQLACPLSEIYTSSVQVRLVNSPEQKHPLLIPTLIRKEDEYTIQSITADAAAPSIEIVYKHPRDIADQALKYLPVRQLIAESGDA